MKYMECEEPFKVHMGQLVAQCILLIRLPVPNKLLIGFKSQITNGIQFKTGKIST